MHIQYRAPGSSQSPPAAFCTLAVQPRLHHMLPSEDIRAKHMMTVVLQTESANTAITPSWDCGNNGIVVIELGRLVQQVPLDRQLSLPLNQCLRSIDQHFLPMHCQDRRDQKQENLVTQILFQVRVVNAVEPLSLPAGICTY